MDNIDINMLNVPIIINNFNRLSSTKKLVEDLLRYKCTNIYILDNKSTYVPLLSWYNTISDKINIIRLDQNIGHLAIWHPNVFNQFKNTPYIYTDSDIELNPSMPENWINVMLELMRKHQKKISLALSIEDIPDHYLLKEKAIDNELRWWVERVKEESVEMYYADTDTTFSLYPENTGHHYPSIRVAGDFTCKHTPWYLNCNCLNEEEVYYLNSIKTATQFSQLLKERFYD